MEMWMIEIELGGLHYFILDGKDFLISEEAHAR